MTEMHGGLCKMIPEDKRPQYQYSGEDVLAKIIIKAVPSEYVTTVQRLKENAMILAKIDALEHKDDESPIES